MRFLVLAFATGFGTGYSPVVSGTVGTLVGVVLFWFLHPGGWPAYLFACIILTWMAILVSTAAEGIYGRKDDGRIVIDEVVGYLFTMLWAPRTWPAIAIGFVLFRFFDIFKFPPARGLQGLRGGKGIVIDDLAAGLYSCIVLHVILWIV
ncbi:phosphatidylglycerophosphatase A [bacterium]|nr:phosphatidylglycerophosphatase A [bacterium]